MNSFLFLFMTFATFPITDGEKRILLNDPTLLQTKLDALETKFMDLMTKYTSQESMINEFKSKNSAQESAITELKSKNSAQDAVINDLRSKLDNSVQGGATYVRWGKMSCPSNATDQIYSGFIGGSSYQSSGGAAEYVCLPPDPDFVSISSIQFHYMHGGEYDNPQAGIPHGEDAPCAVCRSKIDVSTLMIPGRSTCYPGWTRQYHGYLAAGHEGAHSATQFICIDEHPDTLFGGQGGTLDGRIISGVRAKCGSLQCPPYHDGKELSCAVCTK